MLFKINEKYYMIILFNRNRSLCPELSHLINISFRGQRKTEIFKTFKKGNQGANGK